MFAASHCFTCARNCPVSGGVAPTTSATPAVSEISDISGTEKHRNVVEVLGGRAEQRPVDGHPPQKKVQVVFPGQPDPAVELDVLLDDLGRVLANARLGHAGVLA